MYHKLIDNPIVSIYTKNDYGNSSIIKFGGWDESSLMKGTTLQMNHLADLHSLQLMTQNI